jgi:hypothetical protein
MKKSLLLFALLALVLPLSAFAQSPAPAPALAMLQPAATAVQPAAVPQIDWAAIAGISPLTLPDATPTPSPLTLQLPPLGWCSITCNPCPCSGAINFCQRTPCRQ